MSQPINYLFELINSEREVFFSIFNLILLWQKNDEDLITKLAEYKQGIPINTKNYNQITEMVMTICDSLADENSIQTLINNLNKPEQRYISIVMLGWYGKKAKQAIPHLVGIVSGSVDTNQVAKDSIILIGSAYPEVMSMLTESLLDGDDFAFRQLCDLIVQADCYLYVDFIDILQQGANHDNPDIREAVIDTILKINLDKEVFKFIIRKLMNDPEKFIRQAALFSYELLMNNTKN